MKLGELLLKEKRYVEAEKEFLRVLRASPYNREVRLTLGLLYLESGQPERAIEAFSFLRRAYPEDHRFAYLEAAAYEEKRDFNAALQLLKEIPLNSDLYGNARIRMASILKREKRAVEAIAIMRDAIQNKKDAGLYLYLSSLQEGEKDWAGAEETLKEGLKAFPGREDLLYALGAIYEKMKRHDEAVRLMEKILESNPNHADALNFIGYSYVDRGIKLDQAEKMLKRALELKPDSGYILDSVGWLYYRLGKIAAAYEYIEKALKFLPNDPTINEHAGDILKSLNRLSEAKEYYEKALSLDPENGELRKKLDALKK